MRLSRSLGLLLLSLAACGKETPLPQPPAKIPTTYRVLSGVSMGAIGTGALGFSRPEMFDGIGMQGGPLDAAMILRNMDRFYLTFGCTLPELEALLAQGPDALNDPTKVDACSRRTTPIRYEHSQDLNHWHTTTNGGTFDRESYLEIFEDLTVAFGNPLSENPASPVAPPGVDPERIRTPPPDFCSNPVRVKGVYNAEYNPGGKYDAITWCDGERRVWFCRNTQEIVDFCSDPANISAPLSASAEQAFADSFCASKGGAQVANKGSQPLMLLDNWGRVDACRKGTTPVPMVLAVDLNGNGRRDYGEPVINNGQERFDDVGADGCPNAQEDGKGGCSAGANLAGDPNGDDYDADKNPLGTESNWIFDPGEPFRDHGLDGVPGTSDVGEGNGAFDMSAGRRRFFAQDPRTNFRKLDAAGKARLSVLADGGVRDIFNLGLMSKQVYALVAHHAPALSGAYREFTEIPGLTDRNGYFNPWAGNWVKPPKNLLLFYGKDEPTDQDRINGEGDHVGTASQAIDRFGTLFGWAGQVWPSLPRPGTLGGGGIGERQLAGLVYESEALGAKREFAVYLPPGYDAPENAQTRYPVLYQLHGYGMDPSGMMGTSVVADPFMRDGTNGKLRPMILVFPSGRCCYEEVASGARDCREQDDQGVRFEGRAGWRRMCRTGSFYVNGQGYTPGGGVRYADAFFELVSEVDKRFRTLPTTEVETR